MTPDDLKTNWSAHLPQFLTRWPDIEEEDAQTTDGDPVRLAALIAHAEQTTAEDARDQLRTWADGMTPSDVLMDPANDNAQITQSARHIPEGEDVYSEDKDFGDDNLADRPMGKIGS